MVGKHVVSINSNRINNPQDDAENQTNNILQEVENKEDHKEQSVIVSDPNS